ncbi:conserved protein of unknown function [Latilactobacillus sakei]|nr:conserved protein of unknown function [Latilactobacillus sakei]
MKTRLVKEPKTISKTLLKKNLEVKPKNNPENKNDRPSY